MHNLDYSNGRYSFASSDNKPAWHGLGVQVGHIMTAAEAMCEANLCWEVEKHPLYRTVKTIGETGEVTEVFQKIESHMENRRMDTGVTMGFVGKDYECVQNEHCFDFFDNIVGSKEAIFETAGALHQGQVVFITAKLPRDIVVAQDDVLNNYIALVTSHDMSLALTAFFTPVRIVCNNTLNMALQNCQNKVYMKHTVGIRENMFSAAKMMGLSSKYMDKLEEVLKYLYDKQISNKDLEHVLKQTFLNKEQLRLLAETSDAEVSTRKENMILEVMKYYEEDPTQQKIQGKAYGIYNAITGYFQNVKDYSSDELKMKNIVMQGTAWGYAQKAVNALLKL